MSILSLLLFLLSWETGVNWIELLVSLVFIFVFYKYESKQSQPFINVLSLKENLNMSFVYVQFILVNVIFYSIFFGVPLYLQNVRHFDSKTTGLIMLSIAGFGIIVSPLAGRWIDNRGSKPALIAGTSCMIAGSLLLLTIHDSSQAAWIFFCLSVLGLSNGFNNLGLQTALYSFVPPAETGTASGLFMTSRYIGTIFSSSLLGILFGKHFSTSHFHVMAIICVIIGILIMLLTIRMPQKQKQRQ